MRTHPSRALHHLCVSVNILVENIPEHRNLAGPIWAAALLCGGRAKRPDSAGELAHLRAVLFLQSGGLLFHSPHCPRTSCTSPFCPCGVELELFLRSEVMGQATEHSSTVWVVTQRPLSRPPRPIGQLLPGPSQVDDWQLLGPISGESGAGKTESTKLILRFLSAMSQRSLGVTAKAGTSHVEHALLESSPIMESFGNAKTVYNNNSSRFGKFVQLHFCQKGNIQGGKIVDCILFKLTYNPSWENEGLVSFTVLGQNRVVRQNPGERNYHIFYALLAGIDAGQREAFGLTQPESYYYLRQSGCVEDKTINDKDTFHEVLSAMRVMNFSEENIREILRLLAGVLHTGNIEFMTAGGAQISSKSALGWAAELLGLDSGQLAEVLTHRSMILRGEEISTPLSVEQAVDSRDSLAMALYSQCFTWIIRKLNSRIQGRNDFKSIGILDIFGFENFEVNRFEQFNINYANEKLQEYFNKHIFSLEQLEYNKEGLVWEDIDWMDNGECLDMIEKKLGLLALINEESHFPKATDSTLLEKLHGQHSKNPFYVKPRVAVHYFGVKHYAGEVVYDVRGILEKNRDTFRDDILNMLRESRLDFIYDLFEHVSSRNNQDTLKCGSKHRRPTVSSQFKNSLHSLMATLSTSNPFFVRCIKPNTNK
ncbi:hypothetical protein Z043_108930, partial [Scleropages formosus]